MFAAHYPGAPFFLAPTGAPASPLRRSCRHPANGCSGREPRINPERERHDGGNEGERQPSNQRVEFVVASEYGAHAVILAVFCNHVEDECWRSHVVAPDRFDRVLRIWLHLEPCRVCFAR
jgi:hypothetical protein